MHVNFALEGMFPDVTDLLLQQLYIKGELSLNDMLVYARSCAACWASAKPDGTGPFETTV